MLKTLSTIVALLLSACGSATQPYGLAAFEHQLFGAQTTSEHILELGQSATFSSEKIDAQLHPRLAAAFDASTAPAYPLIGRDHANWVRAIEINRTLDSKSFQIFAKSLSPYPTRLSLFIVTAEGANLLADTNSSVWNTGTHFALVDNTLKLQDGDVLIMRNEGAKQSFESRFTVSLK
ncbi:MAG: hypothetical protein H8E25_07050 [Planctomycetes bacterium]|nr:hypothetical protein [Planctomycetota bacterium]